MVEGMWALNLLPWSKEVMRLLVVWPLRMEGLDGMCGFGGVDPEEKRRGEEKTRSGGEVS